MSGPTAQAYVEILEDTLLGRWLPAQTHDSGALAGLSYWRLAGSIEVDVNVIRMKLAVEAMPARKVASDLLSGPRCLRSDHPEEA